MKKISACLLSVFVCMCIFGSVSRAVSQVFAEETSYISEDKSNDEIAEKNESKATLIITVVVVFTITSAATAYITYKKKIKSRK